MTNHPKILGDDIKRMFDLRKAGLGLLGNIIGDIVNSLVNHGPH